MKNIDTTLSSGSARHPNGGNDTCARFRWLALPACALTLVACGGADLANQGAEELETTSVEQALGTYQHWWSGTFNGAHWNLLGDIDGDKRADLVGGGPGYVGAIRSTGSSFGPYETWWSGTFNGSYGTLLGDVDGDPDKKADLVGLGNGYIGVLRSTGNGFGAYETWWGGTFNGTRGNFLGDVTGDGKADLVALGEDYIGVLRSTGSGFGAYETWRWSGFYGTQATLFGDLDGDGKSDLLSISGGSAGVLLSTGTTFGAQQYWGSGLATGTRGTLLKDVTGDGRADLIALNDNAVIVTPSMGDTFGPAQTWYGAFYGSYGTLAGDVTGDGSADLVGMGNGYVGALVSPELRSFGFQAMSERFLPRKLSGLPFTHQLKTLLLIAKFNTTAAAPCAPPGWVANQLSHPDSYYENLVFGPTGRNVNGWYQAMSGGLMSLSKAATVVLSNVSGSWNTDDPYNLARLMGMASQQGFDFAPYDTNNDGIINSGELDVVVVSNYRSYCGTGWAGAARYVGVALNGKTFWGTVAGLEENVAFEVAVHEMTHSLGAPDLYGAGLYGGMSIMGSSAGGVNGTTEFGLDAWHKFSFGWLNPTTRVIDLHTTPSVNVTLNQPVLVYDSLRGRREFVLLENRTASSYQANTYVGVMAWPAWQTETGMYQSAMGAMPSLLATNGGPEVQVSWLSGGSAFSYRMLNASGNVQITAIPNW